MPPLHVQIKTMNQIGLLTTQIHFHYPMRKSLNVVLSIACNLTIAQTNNNKMSRA